MAFCLYDWLQLMLYNCFYSCGESIGSFAERFSGSCIDSGALKQSKADCTVHREFTVSVLRRKLDFFLPMVQLIPDLIVMWHSKNC